MYQDAPQLIIINKEKQREDIIQDEEVFLYKLYAISLESSKPKTSELIFIQEEVYNLKKALKTLQSLTKTISFLLPSYYKTIQQDREKDIQY